jgi:hypothetical protein
MPLKPKRPLLGDWILEVRMDEKLGLALAGIAAFEAL